MKKLSLLIMVLFLASVAGATTFVNDKGIAFNHIQGPALGFAGQEISVYVSTRAIQGSTKENVKVRAYVLDWGTYASSGPFDLGVSNHRSRLLLDVPDYVEPGCYLLRISVTTDHTRRTKHRWICV